MITAIVFASIAWTNSGWASNPEPAPIKASWASDPFARQVLPTAYRDDPEPEPEPAPEPAPAPPPKPAPVVAKTPPAARPTVYRLVDQRNIAWTHTDPRWLQVYVAQRNAQYSRPVYVQPTQRYYAMGSACSGGSCPQ